MDPADAAEIIKELAGTLTFVELSVEETICAADRKGIRSARGQGA